MITLPHQKYLIASYTVNCHDMTVSSEENSIKLPAKVFEFLKLLMANAEQTVTKEQAIEQVWAGNVEVGKRGLGNAIWHLRKTFSELGAEPEEIFKTITKVGYLLLVTPQPIDVPFPTINPENTLQQVGDASANNNNQQATVIDSPDSREPQEVAQTTESAVAASPKNNYLFGYLALTLTLIALWYIFKPSEVAQENNVKKQSVVNNVQTMQPKAKRITNFEGVEELPSISPNGQYMAFQWLQQNEHNQIFIKDLLDDKAPLRQLSVSLDHEVSPVWSPDSQQIAFFRISHQGGSKLYVRELSSNNEQLIDSGGDTHGYMRTISWSPDGSKLAYSKSLADRGAVFQYSFADKSIRQLSSPAPGERDRLMVWSKNSDQLAFIRSLELRASLMLFDENQQEQLLVADQDMIIGLDWHFDKNQLYFNTSQGAEFIIKQYDVASGSTQEFHRDQTIYSIAVDQNQSQLYYTRHIAQEHITVRSLSTGQVQKPLVSSSRDLYGQNVPTTNDILFLSNRSGDWQFWLKSGNSSKQLTHEQAQIAIPAISPVKEEFIVAMKLEEQEIFALYRGLLPSGKLSPLIEIAGDVRKPSYSRDGKFLYFSSNKHGHWGIYKLELATNAITLLIEKNGKYAYEAEDGGLYYTLDNQDGIFYRSADGENSKQVTDGLSRLDWGNFFEYQTELYYLNRSKEHDRLMRIDQEGNEHLAFKLPPLSIRNEKALSLGENGSVIATMLGINDADIYQVPLQ